MNNPAESVPRDRRRLDLDRRQEKRIARRKAALLYALTLTVIAFVPAAIPALPWAKLPDPAPAPKSPHSAEQPAYGNEPAEPAEGLSNLMIRSNR
jgi:hypothetical protein